MHQRSGRRLLFLNSPFSRAHFSSGIRHQKSVFQPNLVLMSVIYLALISAWVAPARGQAGKPQHQNAMANGGTEIARGKYIVEDVAVCGQCHTPHDSRGNPDRARRLQGAPVPWLPARPDSDWPLNAPRIGGTPPASDAEMVKLLTTGIWTNGNHLRAPMPQFRMERSDAEAVVAYLKSITPIE